MRVIEFLEDFASFVDARDTRDALEVVFGVRVKTKEEALDRLQAAFESPTGAEARPEMLEAVLGQVRADDLRRWTRELFDRGMLRDEAIETLAGFYLATEEEIAAAMEDDDVDDDDQPWSDDLDEGEAFFDFRDPRHAQSMWEEFAYDPTHQKTPHPYQREAIAALLSALRSRSDGPQLLHIATGGGKTFVANEIIVNWLGSSGGSVLWVTKDWRLLWQAAGDISRRNHGFAGRVARIGGDGQWLHHLPEIVDGPAVVYTTLHTFQRRASDSGLPRGFRPSLVVWDECHWGEHAKVGRALLKWCKRRSVPLLGLTATPRSPDASEFRVAYSRGFHELVRDGYLSRPRVLEPIRTNIYWSPERSNANSDFRQDSLTDLSKNRRRNELIVDHYASKAAQYGKTIVFACNIDHADRLADLFTSRHGIPARSMHSQWLEHANRDVLDQFKRGELQVVVNVAMLTHGIDVPDAKTVFLCRPTLSDILFSQMIGRASRRDEASGKTEFYVVEFQDNLERFGDQLVTAVRFFEGATNTSDWPPLPPPPSLPADAAPLFDPQGAPTWIPDEEGVHPALRGLWYREGQTFGIEFELTSNEFSEDMSPQSWARTGREVLRELGAVLPGLVASEPIRNPKSIAVDHRVWNLVWDSTAGWEVTTRLLVGRAGFEEVVMACDALERVAERLGLRVNHRTGTHVHLWWWSGDIEELKRAVLLARLFEPAAATLVSPSRIAAFNGTRYDLDEPNPWCMPVSTMYPAERVARARAKEDLYLMGAEDEAKYVTFNIKPLLTQETVEVRMHSGTIEAPKILLWVSLWMQILWAAGNRPSMWERIKQAATSQGAIRDVPDRHVIVPDGDILRLAREYLPSVQQPAFLQRLDDRRRAVRDLWRARAELQEWVQHAECWEPAT